MTDSNNHSQEAASLQGRLFRPVSTAELVEVLNYAVDYRGDVLLELASGEKVEGYVFNLCTTGPHPYLQMFCAGMSGLREIPCGEMVTIAFTGEDTASGKSWEAWVAKKESQRRTESDAAAADALARGNL